MKRLASTTILVCCIAFHCRAAVTMVEGAPRVFGGQPITRKFHLDQNGSVAVASQMHVFGRELPPILVKAEAPGDVTISFTLPEVRARISMVQEIQVLDGEKLLEKTEFPIDVFPQDLLAPCRTNDKKIGVIDEEGKLAAFLEAAKLPIIRLTANAQYDEVKSNIVIVGPNPPDFAVEPMSGLRQFVYAMKTAIFLGQPETMTSVFDPKKEWKVIAKESPRAEPVVKHDHPILLDIGEHDLENWAGSGAVATEAIEFDDWTFKRPWLYSPAPNARPLLTEYWNGSGRVVRCQLNIVDNYYGDPAAQILLRNLILWAQLVKSDRQSDLWHFTLMPPPEGQEKPIFNAPLTLEERKSALASIVVAPPFVLIINSIPRAEDVISGGYPTLVQSGFDPMTVDALNDLMKRVFSSERNPPQFTTKKIAAPEVKALDYRNPLLSGIHPEIVTRATEGLSEATVPVLVDAKKEIEEIIPGVVYLFKRDKQMFVFCAIPLDKPENQYRKILVDQIVANLAEQPKEIDIATVK